MCSSDLLWMRGQNFHHDTVSQRLKTEHYRPGFAVLKLDHHQIFVAAEILRNEAECIVCEGLRYDIGKAQRHVVPGLIECAARTIVVEGIMPLIMQRALGENVVGKLHQNIQVGIWIASFSRDHNGKGVEMGHAICHAIDRERGMGFWDRQRHPQQAGPSVAHRELPVAAEGPNTSKKWTGRAHV